MRVGRAFDVLARRIRAEGPMSVADYMAIALSHPEVGYYATRDPFGPSGDFVTAPEVSQVFGELLGLWCAERWQAMGEPQQLLLVELGPGRGTLMADALRAAQLLPAFRAALDIHLVEASALLREQQRRALASEQITWHRSFAEVPEGPLLLIANEFFDALPIRQFVKTSEGWAERLIALDEGEDQLVWAVGRLLPPGLPLPQDAQQGSIAELSPLGTALAEEIGRRLARFGGAALIIDYGHDGKAIGDSFQALRQHRPLDPLECPGDADLTAHVNFGSLVAAAEKAGAKAHGPVEQTRFLEALGIKERSEALARNATPQQRRQLLAALDRLISPSHMGSLFKAVALTPPDSSIPAGFPVTP